MRVVIAIDPHADPGWVTEGIATFPLTDPLEVVLVSALDVPRPPLTSPGPAARRLYAGAIAGLRRDAAQCAEAVIEAMRPALRPRAASVAVRIVDGRPGPTILDAAASWNADLILVGSNGRGPIRRVLLGSVSDDVVRAAPCPVLVVKRRVTRFERMLVATDGSLHAEGAVRFVAALPVPTNAELRVCAVSETPDAVPGAGRAGRAAMLVLLDRDRDANGRARRHVGARDPGPARVPDPVLGPARRRAARADRGGPPLGSGPSRAGRPRTDRRARGPAGTGDRDAVAPGALPDAGVPPMSPLENRRDHAKARDAARLPRGGAVTETAWYHVTSEEALRELGATPAGLSPAEAATRLARYGPNTLREEKGVNPWHLLFAQFKNFLILLLVAATALSLLLGHTLDAVIIFSIVILSALLGFYQEFRAERAMQALKAMASPTASVMRGGEPVEIASADVVPGDILILRAGDRLPADARLLEAVNLRADEASLTGESTAVEKDANLRLPADSGVGDRRNMVFAGTATTYGRGQAVVTATGMQTEFGRIAKMLQEVEEEPSPLAVKMDYIGKRLGTACLGVSAVVVLLGIVRGNPPLEMLIWGVSLAIAAVPKRSRRW